MIRFVETMTHPWVSPPQQPKTCLPRPLPPHAEQPRLEPEEGGAQDEEEGGHQRQVDEEGRQDGHGGA